jgi:DnaJ-class molecular chaperone
VPVVAVGGQVVVTGTEDAKLKLRAGPGLNQETLLFVEDGTLLQVLEGPESGDGYIWWKVQVPDGQVGWVAGEWLEPVTP